MPIYEYQGKHYDIETTDPAEAKAKILAALPKPETTAESLGRSTASLADTALNTAGGLVESFNYPFNLAYRGVVQGKPLAQASAEAQQAVALPKDVVGRAFGVTGTPSYENAPLRRAGTAIGETVNENVIQPAATATGLPPEYIGNVLNTATMAAGPVVPKAAGAVVRGAEATAQGVKNAAGAAVDVGKGAYGGFTGTTRAPGQPVKPWETPSARQPVGETYIPADALEQWRSGKITAEQAQAAARPTSELPQAALRRTEGMVPYAGQEWRALGEQIGSSYRDPVKLLAEAAGDVAFGGVPTVARGALKGYGLYQGQKAFRQLGEAGFTPITPAEQTALRGGGYYPNAGGPVAPGPTPPGGGGGFPMPAQLPQLGYNPNPGQTPMPMGGPPRAVNIEGQRSVLPYDINTANSQTARPVSGPVSPMAVAQQAAAQKITPPTTPLQAAAQETVAQKAQRVMGDRYRAPVSEQPVAGPVAPVASPAPAPVVAAPPVVKAPVNTPAVKGTEMPTTEMTKAEKSKLTREKNKANALQKIENDKAIALAKEEGKIKYTLQDSDLTQTGSGNHPLKHQDAIDKIEQDKLTKNKNVVWGAGEYNNSPAKWKYDPNGNSTIIQLGGLKNDKVRVKWDYTPDTTTQTYGKQVIVWKDGKVVKYIDTDGIDKLKELKEKGGISDPKNWSEPTFDKKLKQISNPGQE